MGRPKQLLPLNEKPLISHCLETIISSGIEDVTVVLGEQATEMRDCLDDFRSKQKIRILFNDAPESEMAESVRIGCRAIDTSCSGVMICLCDHPLVSKETIKEMVAFHEEDPEKIIIPVYQGKRGHPTLFPRAVIAQVFEGLTLREIIRKNPERLRLAEVPDEGITIDLDTTEDYRKVLKRESP